MHSALKLGSSWGGCSFEARVGIWPGSHETSWSPGPPSVIRRAGPVGPWTGRDPEGPVRGGGEGSSQHSP